MERTTLAQSPDIMETGVEQGPSPDKSLEAASRLAVLLQNGYVKAVLRQDVAAFKTAQARAYHYYLVFVHIFFFVSQSAVAIFRTGQFSNRASLLRRRFPAAETTVVILDLHQLPEKERLEGVGDEDGGAHTHQGAHSD